MDKIKLAVYNEYALGYIMPERPDTFYTLRIASCAAHRGA